MAAHDSGVDTSNDSNSAIEMSINLRQMENSIKDYVALMQADLNTDPTTTAGTSYKVPKTPHFAQERCERSEWNCLCSELHLHLLKNCIVLF